MYYVFFFKQKTAYEMRISDWSSDVCSSDLSETGPGEVTAGQIATTGDIEVMNPDLVLCHLDEGATLNMELTSESGKGYVPAASNRPVDAPIGLLPIDAPYSPVQIGRAACRERVCQYA